MNTDPDPPIDQAWDNRRLILASLAPRTVTRPARRGTSVADPDDIPAPRDDRPGVLSRGLQASGQLARSGARRFNKRVPRERRLHTAVITIAAVVILLAALSGVKYLSTDVHPEPRTAPTTPTPTAAPQAPLIHDTILKDITATDACPKDGNYSDANRAVDGDITTAGVCTRAKNKDGQILQISFGRQVTLTQIRVICGFDATAPDGTDQWSKHRICTSLEVWFPKDLKRDPILIDTGGIRDWRPITLSPPATVSKLLIRVKETSDPPQPATPTTDTAAPGPDNVTTIAISEIQFIGTDSAHA